jgi:hypothetical protein
VLDPLRVLVQAHDTRVGDQSDDAQAQERKCEADLHVALHESELAIDGLTFDARNRLGRSQALGACIVAQIT